MMEKLKSALLATETGSHFSVHTTELIQSIMRGRVSAIHATMCSCRRDWTSSRGCLMSKSSKRAWRSWKETASS